MTEKCDVRNGPTAEQGETAREESLVAAVLESIDGEDGESKVKFSSNIVKVGETYVAIGRSKKVKDMMLRYRYQEHMSID